MQREVTREAPPRRTLDEQLRKLEAELRTSKSQLKRALDLLEKHQQQLSQHESSLHRLDRILMDLLTGRVWRTLSAAGKLAKRFLPGAAGSAGEESVALSRQRSILVCDEPKASDPLLRSGSIAVRGWCVAEGGVDHLQIEIGGVRRAQVSPSIPRPDVKLHHPQLDATGRSGFSTAIDTADLPNGRHLITLRLISGGKPIRETRTAIQIDHQNGFASDYDRWIKDFEQAGDQLIALKAGAFDTTPLFSVLMPVFNTAPEVLAAAIASVQAQSYANWELCIADDSSSRADTRALLQRFASENERIKVAFRSEQGGISRACNDAWQLAAGDYVCFLDHDDALAPHALAYLCEALDRYPDADLLYSDEDKLDELGRRFDPFFKPDWSPDLLLSENYICHLLVLRQDLARKIGRLHPDCDGSQDYDLVLRAAESAQRIVHVPHVLYHWRAAEGSTALTQSNKEYAIAAAQRALEQHLERTGAALRIEAGKAAGRWRARYPVPAGTHVSILIASGGKLDVLRTNLESLFGKTTFKQYEVVVIDNSKANAIQSYIAELARQHANLRYLDWRNKPFNYSAINNAAARACESPVLLFLNDDTSVIEPGWLEAMTELAVRPEVGAVGAKLLYPSGLIQHAGVVMGLFDNCGHAFKGLDGTASHYFDFPDVIRNVSAVTGACLMTRAEVFWQAGGFDEVQFAVAFNDIDLCMKIANQGYRVLYTPHALLYHHEAFSKTSKDLVPHPDEVEAMRLKWERAIEADPYYNPNLTRNDEDYSLQTRV